MTRRERILEAGQGDRKIRERIREGAGRNDEKGKNTRRLRWQK